ncbi:MAG: hypothetical protein RLZZ416_59 [Candidatus Parcubacteria bacterium]|jgi:hypothetical protein
MKRFVTVTTILFALAPLASFALTSVTSASASAQDGADASAAVQTIVTGGGTYRTEITTEENGVVRTEVQEGRVPSGARIEIHIATSTPSMRIDERLRADTSASSSRETAPEKEPEAVSSTDIRAESSLTVFFNALFQGFAKIFSIFGWH